MRWPVYPAGGPKRPDMRKLAVAGFHKYLVFYRIVGGVVRILRVIHGSRNLSAILKDA